MSEIEKIVMLKEKEFAGRECRIVATDGQNTYRLRLVDSPDAPTIIRNSEDFNEKKIFTSADVFADDENDTVIDEGYFTGGKFYSTLVRKFCDCNTKIQHEAHLQEVVHNVGSEDAE